MANPGPGRGRVAISFGSARSPSSTSSARPPASRPQQAHRPSKRPRLHAWDAASDSDSADDAHASSRHQPITGFGAQGAETKAPTSGGNLNRSNTPYIIDPLPNRDWKADVKSSRRQKPPPSDPRPPNQSVADEQPELKWGLTVVEPKTTEAESSSTDVQGQQLVSADASSAQAPSQQEPSADAAALAALLESSSKPKAIIQPSSLTEDQAYRRDAASAGAVSTLDDYEAMPVDEFGAALLRGMGWNGEPRGPRLKEVRRRPNRLGLGAKELKDAEDLGGWNQAGAKKKRPRLDEYRREESRRKEKRSQEDSYKRERDRERDREQPSDGHHRDREPDRHAHRSSHHDRRRDRHGDYDQYRRR